MRLPQKLKQQQQQKTAEALRPDWPGSPSQHDQPRVATCSLSSTLGILLRILHSTPHSWDSLGCGLAQCRGLPAISSFTGLLWHVDNVILLPQTGLATVRTLRAILDAICQHFRTSGFAPGPGLLIPTHVNRRNGKVALGQAGWQPGTFERPCKKRL